MATSLILHNQAFNEPGEGGLYQRLCLSALCCPAFSSVLQNTEGNYLRLQHCEIVHWMQEEEGAEG